MNKTIDYLLKHGDAIIKYRILTEFMSENDTNFFNKTKEELLLNNNTRKRLNFLSSKEKLHDSNGIHGSTNTHLENSLPMLLDYGFANGINEFDQSMENIMSRIKKYETCEVNLNSEFMKSIIYPFISKAGFANEYIKNYMCSRLSTLYDFTSQKSYDIYDDLNYTGIPKNFSNRRILRTELYSDNIIRIPLIYDIYMLAELVRTATSEEKKKIDTIIEYILDDEYEKIDEGYGLLVTGTRRYLAMGWDAKLPSIHNGVLTSKMLHRLELLSNFDVAVNHRWFKQVYKICEEHKLENEMYLFPKESMVESESNWVYGNHMSYGENRRKKDSLLLESTFKMLCINNNINRGINL